MENYIRLACNNIDKNGTTSETVIQISGPGMTSSVLSKMRKAMKVKQVDGYEYPDIFGVASEVLTDEGYTVEKIITVFNVEV